MSELPSTPTPEPKYERHLTLIEGEKSDETVVDQLYDETLSDGTVSTLARGLIDEKLTPDFFRTTNKSEQAIAIFNHILFSSTILRGNTSDEDMVKLNRLRERSIEFWNPTDISRSDSISDERMEIRQQSMEEIDRSEHTNLMRLCDQLRVNLSSHAAEMTQAQRMVLTMLYFGREQ